jgi:O-antigen biosynthesis protein WbqP
MIVSAPQKSHQEFENIKTFVTPFGMLIRKTSLDELPQLINVIKGEMSLVGPRPLAATDQEALNLRQISGVDQVLPGMTGLAQINGRNLLTDRDKVNYDKQYVNQMSWRQDVLIMGKTVIVVIRHIGIFKS